MLEEVLRDAGFVPVAEARAPETVLAKGDVELTVPLPFVIQSSRVYGQLPRDAFSTLAKV
jgi:hypothetical protein